jgi:sulfate transporter 4
MSYAKLAGLPVEYGLYSAFIPTFVYGLFGTSRQLIVGPVALISLLLGNGLSHQMKNLGIGMEDTNYTQVITTLAIQTSFIVGILNVAMGLFRLGFVTAFLSHAVISGFISGAAVIIFLSQLKHILGIKAEGGNVVITMSSLLKNIHKFNDNAFLMGTFSLILLLLIKKLSTMLPTQKWLKAVGPIFITAVSIVITWQFHLDKLGLPIVSYIPKGLPDVTAGLLFPMNQYGNMIMTAVSISIIGFIESIAIVKSLSLKNNYDVDSSLELVGLGMSNLIGSIFQAYPSTGSFSRSAVNNDAGAQSPVSAMVSSMLVGFVLLFLTDVFQYMVCRFCLHSSTDFSRDF